MSVVTLRRMVKGGRLLAESRVTTRDPYLFTVAALISSGLLPKLASDVTTQPTIHDYSADYSADYSRVVAALDKVTTEVETLRKENRELIDRAARAEGQLEGVQALLGRVGVVEAAASPGTVVVSPRRRFWRRRTVEN